MISLETRGLYKSFGSLTVTQEVNLCFQAGMRYAVIGPNGAGKTTLFNLLTGEFKPTAGQILLGSHDVTSLGPDARARKGLARSFQRNNLFPDLTVLENLAIACAIRTDLTRVFWRRFESFRGVQARAEELATTVGLQEVVSLPVRHLSYGNQRQLEVGLALACDPVVLLLDEPTSGMGPEETAIMQSMIVALSRTLTIIVVEHDMDIVFSFADRIVVLDYGRVLAEGTVAEIRNSEIVRSRYLGEGHAAGSAA
jgi:branched-chain amino acid transport system ATP-binding protein